MPQVLSPLPLASLAPYDQGPPALHNPLVLGATPARPFSYSVPATGARPIRFSAQGLPQGLRLDPIQGHLSGYVSEPIEIQVELAAENAHGKTRRPLTLRFGDTLSLTPPLGWSSWNVWGAKIDSQKIYAAACALVNSGLSSYGYSFINIDDGWQGVRDPATKALLPNSRFSNLKALCDAIHALGLKVGLYSTPWQLSYAGFCGSSEGPIIPGQEAFVNPKYPGRHICQNRYELEDALQWARWGIDYLKYDWFPIDKTSVLRIEKALKDCGRDIILSLSNHLDIQSAPQITPHANLWRTCFDIQDSWSNLKAICEKQNQWARFTRPGHYNDPDMLVIGRLGWGAVRPNRLSECEQLLHITLWAIWSSPLLIGCDLSQLDDFSLRLLCNEEVLSVNQDPLGKQAPLCFEIKEGEYKHLAFYQKPLADSSIALAIVNWGEHRSAEQVRAQDLGLSGSYRRRDLWARQDLGPLAEHFTIEVPPHGALFYRLARDAG